MCDFFESSIVDGDFTYNDSTFLSTVLGVTKLVRLEGSLPSKKKKKSSRVVSKNPHYVIQPLLAHLLFDMAMTNEHFFDFCADLCATNLLANAPLPYHLRVFASGVVGGEYTRPKKNSRPVKKNWFESVGVGYLV